jgi:hypothetical protein
MTQLSNRENAMLTKEQILEWQGKIESSHHTLDAMMRAQRLAQKRGLKPDSGVNLLIIEAARDLEALCSSLVFEMTGGPAATEVHHA